MDAARHGWFRSTGSALVVVLLFVVLLSVAGFAVTKRAVGDERTDAAHRRAEVEGLKVQGQLERARAFAVGVGNALEGERAPDSRRFAALVGSATATVGLTAAIWVEQVSHSARLPATFVTGVAMRAGGDMARVPALATTLRDPTSVFAGTATRVASLAGRRGFFVVEGARFGRGPGSRGYLVVFVPADWLATSLNLDRDRTAISLGGRPLSGRLAAAPAAGRSFAALRRRWRVDVARDPATALQATLPWLGLAWPPATALLVYLLGRGLLRRRRAERQVDDIFDLSPDLLCIGGFDGYFKRVNPAFESTLGYAAADLLSRPLLEFVHADDRQRTAEMLVELREGRHSWDFENRCVRSDGAVRWLQWNTRSVPDKGLMYAAARDVTEHRRLTAELAASRRRIVATADEARQRIERDLHDGAQQRLVSTVVVLRMLQRELGESNGAVRELVDEALANAERGMDEVREIARGVHPRILASGGLGPALEILAGRSRIPVALQVQTERRFPENVEVTAYYVASEALTNAVKYARGSEVRISVEADDEWIDLTVADDGVGGADPSRGSGLTGLKDRVAAVGGALVVESKPDAGTVVAARIPIATPAAGDAA